jgi:hypothetical protein
MRVERLKDRSNRSADGSLTEADSISAAPVLLGSALHPDIAAWRILNGREPAPADRPGRNVSPILRLAPGLPVRPPGSRVLLRGFKPGVELSHRRPARPVLIPVSGRRVHNSGDMARAGHDEPDGPTKELRP